MKSRSHKGLSRSFLGLLVGAGVVALFLLGRELPAMRRYLRLERM